MENHCCESGFPLICLSQILILCRFVFSYVSLFSSYLLYENAIFFYFCLTSFMSTVFLFMLKITLLQSCHANDLRLFVNNFYLFYFIPIQPLPDEKHTSSGEEDEVDVPYGGNLAVREEEDKDTLVNNSSEQLV